MFSKIFNRVMSMSLSKNKLKVLSLVYASVLLTSFYASQVYAFQTSHGFLPPGTSACELHVPVTLSVPDNAQPEPVVSEFSHGFYHIAELEDGLFYITDGVYQMMMLVSHEGIILVDAPPSIGVNAMDPAKSITLVDVVYSIEQTQGIPIKKLVYSHSHLDHIGAASIVQDAFPKLEIIAHTETNELIKRGTGEIEGLLQGIGSNPPPLATEVFDKKKKIEVGKQVLKLSYKGATHEPGNIFVYAPKQKVLMLVDVIFPGWSPFNNLALAKSVHEYIEAYDEVLAYNFETFIGGHLGRLGARADVQEGKMYIQDIKSNALSALQNPANFTIFGIVQDNPLAAFNIYLNEMACDCANRTLDATTTPSGKDWRGRLGSADINTLTHCWTIGEAMRIDSEF